MSAGDARPVPRQNVAFRITFPIYNLTGMTVPASTSVRVFHSVDASAFTATTDATNIGKGVFYSDIAAGNMNCDTLSVYASAVVSGSRPFVAVIYPEAKGDVRADAIMWQGTTVAAVVTAGAPSVNIVAVSDTSAQGFLQVDVNKWAHTSVGSMPAGGTQNANVISFSGVSAAGIPGVNVSTWANTSVAAVVGGGAPSVNVIAFSGVSAAGIPGMNVSTWANTSVAAVVTAGAPSVNILAINGASAQSVPMVDVTKWAHGSVAALVGGVPSVDVISFNGASAGAAPQVDVTYWGGSLVNNLISGRVDSNPGAIQAAASISIWSQAFAEVTAPPAAAGGMHQKVGWLFALSRNKITQTSSAMAVLDDAQAVNIGSAATSDDGVTFTRSEWST